MSPTCPGSIPALLLRLLRLRLKILALVIVLASITGVWLAGVMDEGPASAPVANRALRLASFNIEYFPKNQQQVEEAFAEIEKLGAGAIGVQEITDPARFASEAKRRLGKTWKFVHRDLDANDKRPRLHIGLLYDSALFKLQSAESREETRIDAGTQPSLQVRLRERASDQEFTMLIVHFKALPEGRARRARQFAGLDEIIGDQQSKGRRLVIMGDFNTTEEADRKDLAALARTTGLTWASEDLACSAFWERSEDCPTSRLDHVLTWKPPTQTIAKGGCEDGCQMRSSCPIYRHVVSDHCPVVVDLKDLLP